MLLNNWQTFISIAASFFSFLYFVPYLVTVCQGKTRPNRASWWIWGTNGLIMCASYYFSNGATNTLWALFFPVIAQLIIAVLSFKYGQGGWNRFDKICLSSAGVGLVLWWRFNSPLIALALSLVVDFMGALPTIKKSYYEPKTESLVSWFVYGIGTFLNLFTIKNWSIEIAAVPLYVFFINVIIVSLLLLPKVRLYLSRRHKYKRKKMRKRKI